MKCFRRIEKVCPTSDTNGQLVGVLEWTVIGKVTDYGQNVTLFCNVVNCCPKDAGWDRWTPVQRTLFIDVKSGRSNKKYDGKALKNGYTLVIQNLTEQDLNVSYSCLYGVTLGEQKLLLKEYVFTDITTGHTRNSTISESHIVGILVGVGVIVALAVALFVFYFWRRRKSRKFQFQVENENNRNEVDPLIDKVRSSIECTEGDDAVFTYKSKTDNLPVNLSKAGKKIVGEEHRDGKYKFQLKNTQTRDSGEYALQVRTFFRKTFHLDVKVYFREDPSNFECKEGEEAIFTCSVLPDSPPVVLLKEKKDVTKYWEISMDDESKHSPIIYKLTLKTTTSSDSGEYVLQVGKSSRKVLLKIKEIVVDSNTREIYREKIKFRKEVRKYVRIQVIGKDGVGKTSLVRRLLGYGEHDGSSTDGIEIDRNCHIRTSDGKWIIGKVTEKQVMINRMKRILQDENMKEKEIKAVGQPYVSTKNVKETQTHQKLKILHTDLRDTEKNEENTAVSGKLINTKEEQEINVVSPITEKIVSKHTDIESSANTNLKEQKLEITDCVDYKTETTITEPISSKVKKTLEKTSSYEETENDTQKIIKRMDEIFMKANLTKEDLDGLVECGIWDFAGQKEYYGTHQTFFTKQAIYILVADIESALKDVSQDNEFDSIGKYINFWFENIHCFCDDVEGINPGALLPAVFVVFTYTDKVNESDDDKAHYERQLLTFGDKKQNHRRGIYYISNTRFEQQDSAEIDRLKEDISAFAKKEDYFPVELPTEWIQLENALEALKESKKDLNFLSWKEIKKIANKASIKETEKLDDFLKYQHDIGNIIFFNDIKEYIILKPLWLVKCFRCLVFDSKKRDYDLVSETAWESLTSTGGISMELIRMLFQKESGLQIKRCEEYLLKVMVKFDIIIEPTFLTPESFTKDKQPLDLYYIPCMITNNDCIDSFDKIKGEFIVEDSDATITPWLVLEFIFLPLVYFNHILFNFIRKYRVCLQKSDHRPALYRGKAVFVLDKSSRFILCFSHNAISLQVWEWEGKKECKYGDILNELCNCIDMLKGKFKQNISYHVMAKCSKGDYFNTFGRISSTDKIEGEIYTCHEHGRTHRIKDEDLKNTWFKHAIQREITERKKKQAEEEKEVIRRTFKEIPSEAERNNYLEAMQSGTEVRQYVRIHVIGKRGVGKTSLVRRLLGQGIDDVKGTDGVDIDRTCQIRISDGEWIVGEVETEKMERIRRLLQAVDIKQNETEPTSKQSQALSKKEEKRNVQKLDNSIETEKRQNKSHQSNKHSIKPDEKKNESEKTTSESVNSSAASKSNSDEENINTNDKDSLPKPSENDTLTPKQMHDESFLSPVNFHIDHITDAMTEEMNSIICDAKNQKDKITSEGLVKCGIWEFADRKDYYATHQTFFTPHAIYILVADITEDIKIFKQDEEFNSIGDKIDFWLDCIHCFCEEGSDHDNQLCPPVFIVCTGTDKVVKVEDRKWDYNKQFDRIFFQQPKVNHKRGIYFVSNTEEGNEEIVNLKSHISSIAKQMEYFAENLPTKWIHLENALAVLKGLDIIVYEWENMLKLAQKNSIGEDELLLFLNYQHKIGNVIFFNELREYIILQPDWLIRCFRCLVYNGHPDKRKDALSETACQTLKTTGELSETLIDRLFQKEPSLQFGKRKHFILHVMEKFDIIVRPEFRDAENDKFQKSHSYYLPCMIEKSVSFKSIKKMFIDRYDRVTITPWLVLDFRFLPLAYFNHILCYYLRNYTVCKEQTTEEPAIYVGKAVFYLDPGKLSKFIVCFSRNAISLQIWTWSAVDEDMYKQMFNELCDVVEHLIGTQGQTISYHIQAKCSSGDFASRVGRIRIECLTEKDSYLCEEHKAIHSKTDIVKTWLKHDCQRRKDRINNKNGTAEVKTEQQEIS